MGKYTLLYLFLSNFRISQVFVRSKFLIGHALRLLFVVFAISFWRAGTHVLACIQRRQTFPTNWNCGWRNDQRARLFANAAFTKVLNAQVDLLLCRFVRETYCWDFVLNDATFLFLLTFIAWPGPQKMFSRCGLIHDQHNLQRTAFLWH